MSKRPEEELRAMTVSEAGRLGGLATRAKHGPEFFVRLGRRGGQRMKELIARGKALEAEEKKR